MDLVPGLEGYQGLARATSLSTLHPIRLACLVPPYRVKDFARQNGVGCRLEITITHVPRHDFVVIAHTLDHEILDRLANAEFELVQRIGKSGMNHLLVLDSFLPNLLEEEPIFLSELRSEAVVQYFNDLRQRGLLVSRLATANLGRTLDCLRVTLLEINRSSVDALQAVVLEFDLIP
jgi:hypothetical protein